VLGSGKDGPLQNKVVAEIAHKHGIETSAVCIAWGLRQGCAVLSKSTNPDRIRVNFDAENVQLDNMDMEKLRGINKDLMTCNMVEYWGFPSHC
jgi:diketogulonate reductase-like aldo/keto reductase